MKKDLCYKQQKKSLELKYIRICKDTSIKYFMSETGAKCKVHSEVFEVFTGRPRGNNLNHIIIRDAGLAMAKRVLHPPEAERWPSA